MSDKMPIMDEISKFIEQMNAVFDQYPAIPIGMLIVLFIFSRLGKKKRSAKTPGFLDRSILSLGGIPFTGRMATEGLFTCAELGWGKTFLVFRKVLKAFVQAGMGGFLLGAKAEDLDTVRKLFRGLGMEDRLVVIGPRHLHKINCFDALASIAPQDSIEEEMIGFFTSLMEIESRSAAKSSGENAQFFIAHGQRLLGSILICLRIAGERITATNIYKFLVSLPNTAAEIKTPAFRDNYACKCLEKTHNAAKSSRDTADYENAHRYLLRELANLGDRTRPNVISTVSSMISRLLRGWMAELYSTTSTVRIQEVFKGKWIYVDTSPLEYGEYGVSSLVMMKHLAERAIMRRRVTPDSRAVAIMGDEWQAIFVKADRDYQAVCRSQLGVTWGATQNLTGLYSVLGGGQDAEAQAQSWVALFGAKIFGANSDWKTNTYASQLCGMGLEAMMSGGLTRNKETTAYDMMTGNFQSSSNFGEQYQPVVRPEHFVRLRKPEPPCNEADAIVVMPRLQQIFGCHWAQVTLRPE